MSGDAQVGNHSTSSPYLRFRNAHRQLVGSLGAAGGTVYGKPAINRFCGFMTRMEDDSMCALCSQRSIH